MKLFTNTWILCLTLFFTLPLARGQDWSSLGDDLSSEELVQAIGMSADGLTVALGSPFNGNNIGNEGTVRVYRWNGSSWAQKGNVISGENSNDNLGYSVALDADGNTMVIGSVNNDDFDNDAGKSYVYSWNGSNWDPLGSPILGEGFNHKSGGSVSINNAGDIIAIGAYNSEANGIQSGDVRLFQWDGSDWIQLGNTIAGEAPGDRSGSSVDLTTDGLTVAIGAITNADGGSGAGHARVFTYDGSDWIQKGDDLDGTAGERFGRKVSISSDGSRLAVGASINFDDNTGVARVYEWDGSDWVQLGTDFVGAAEDAELGSGVALNKDGTIFVLGSPGNANNFGKVDIYTWEGNAWSAPNTTVSGTLPNPRLGFDVAISLSGRNLCVSAGEAAWVLRNNMITSVNGPEVADDITIIPNPAVDELRIDTDQNISEVLITGINGQVVLRARSAATLNISELPAGSYIVQIKTTSGTFVKKLMKVQSPN